MQSSHWREGAATIAADRPLREYETLEYLLIGDLRDLLEEPPSEESCRWILAVIDALLDMLPHEFALEERGGYMNEVLDEYPSWEPLVDELRFEHGSLYAGLEQLRNYVACNAPFAEIAHEVRRDLRDWMKRLVAHNRHETRLLQTALTLEVGAGD